MTDPDTEVCQESIFLQLQAIEMSGPAGMAILYTVTFNRALLYTYNNSNNRLTAFVPGQPG